MTDDRPRDVQALWQAQPAAGGPMPLDELRSRSRILERRIRWRNLREYVGCGVVVLGFGRWAWAAETPLIRIGACLTVAAAVFVAYYLYRWGSALPMPGEMAQRGCLQFHRTELERQRDLLRSVWTWYLLPVVPGVVVLNVGVVLAHPERLSHVVRFAVFAIAMFVVIGLLNGWVANRIQRRIDALERDS
jgi:hypothetical protein